MGSILEFLKGGTFRRIIAALVAVAIPPLNKLLKIDLPEGEVISMIGALAVYIGQSVYNTVSSKKIAADAAAKIVTVKDAAQVLAPGSATIVVAPPVPVPMPIPGVTGVKP